MFTALSHFTPLVWTAIFGTFLTRFTYFMIWPFMAVLLKQRFELDPLTIGLILSGAALAGSSFSFFVGNASDRFGRRVVLVAGTLTSATSYALLAIASQLPLFIFCVLLAGAGWALLEPPSKAMMSDDLSDPKSREMAFNLRYFMLNVGAALGPLVGIALGLTGQQPTFLLLALSYLLFAIAVAWFSRHQAVITQQQKAAASLARTWTVLKVDRAFQLLVLANLLIMMCYAQFEATLVQFIGLVRPDSTVSLYAMLVTTNALAIVCCQFPLLALLRTLALHQRIYLSLALFALGFSAYGWIPHDQNWAWIAATAVMSLGEAILFPTLNIQIDTMAPKHLKGSYFGASALYGYGFALGPALGGLLLQWSGAGVWLAAAGLAALAMLLYVITVRLLPARAQWIDELEHKAGLEIEQRAL